MTYSKPRRSRFTITFSTGEQTVMLAFPGQDEAIQRHYARYGKTVVNVERGDFRKASNPSGPGFAIDQDALAAAIDLLGITMPVKIRFNSRAGATQGNYRFRNGGHDIMLKSYHDAAQASSTLWHELTHAMQAERCGGTAQTWSSFTREQARWSYRNRPIEIEARKMSADMADCPLVIERKA